MPYIIIDNGNVSDWHFKEGNLCKYIHRTVFSWSTHEVLLYPRNTKMLENLKEILLQEYMHFYIFIRFKSYSSIRRFHMIVRGGHKSYENTLIIRTKITRTLPISRRRSCKIVFLWIRNQYNWRSCFNVTHGCRRIHTDVQLYMHLSTISKQLTKKHIPNWSNWLSL